MNKKTAQRYAHLVNSLALLGFTMDETDRLLKIERTLHRWHELECGSGNDYGTTWHVEREETTKKPFMVMYFRGGQKSRRSYPDKEKGALRRLSEILKGKNVTAYQQGDPRGCALYLVRPGDVPEGESVDSFYSREIALCID